MYYLIDDQGSSHGEVDQAQEDSVRLISLLGKDQSDTGGYDTFSRMSNHVCATLSTIAGLALCIGCIQHEAVCF